MARSWGELLGEEDARPEPENGGGGMFARLRDSLGRSRRALTEQIGAATFDAGDEASWERLEEALIAADVGVPATAELVQRLEARPDAGAGLTDDAGTQYRYSSAGLANNTNNTQSATWKFDGLDPQFQYQVFATWQPAGDRASNAPYTISGARAVGSGNDAKTVFVDQRYTPGEFTTPGGVET
jgi:hypothetical protein